MTKKKEVAPKTAKKVAPKKVAPKAKKKVAPKPTVELVSYSIRMVIPTGQYANVQPEIIVKSNSLEDAHAYIAPHMNKMWKEYYLVNERRPEIKVQAPTPPAPTVVATPAKEPTYVPLPGSETVAKPIETPMTAEEIIAEVGGTIVEEMPKQATTNPSSSVDSSYPAVQSPVSGVAFTKASQAINSCFSLDALEIIRTQVDKSVKLTDSDKSSLQPLLMEKFEALSNG